MNWNIVPSAEWLETEEQVTNAGQYLANSTAELGLSVDTETTGLDTVRDRPVMFSLSDGIRRFAAEIQWMRHPWMQKALIENKDIFKILTNAKFDKHMLANVGIDLAGPLRDTVVMSWLDNENRRGHGLKDTAKDHLGLQMKDFKEVFPMRRATKKVPGESAGEAIARVMADYQNGGRAAAIEYAGLDAYASHHVHGFLQARLQDAQMYKGCSLWDHFLSVEVPFTDVLWNMERRGFTICVGHLLAQKGPMEMEMQTMEEELAVMAGWLVNPDSPKQLQKLFYQQLGRKPEKFTDTKQPSTDADVLEEWAGQGDPYSTLILKFRSFSKNYGTYINGMLSRVDPELRIHTTLKQHGTVTGRLSSSDPNLQNIPRPATDKFGIRSAFVADMGKRLVVLDYDQLEMKIMAHYSGDEKMIKAILDGLDLHCYTVSLMYGENYDDVFKAKKAKEPDDNQKRLLGLRQAAKNVGFGLIYGIGAKKLGHDLTKELGRVVDVQEAQNMILRYFGVFPGVQRFIKGTHAACKRTEHVQTLVGRFRRLPQINAGGGAKRSRENEDPDVMMGGIAAQAARQAVNTIIQGTAADIAKQAMMRIEGDEELAALGSQMLLQIHDELISEVEDDPDKVAAVKARKKVIMEEPWPGFALAVPLTVGGSSGYSWSEAK